MPSTQLTELTNAENLLGPRGSRVQLFGGSRDHWEWSQNLWRCTRFVMGVALKIHDKTETSIEITNKPWFFITYQFMVFHHQFMDVPWNKPSSDSIGVPHWLRKPPAMEPRSCVKIQQGTWEWMHMVHIVNVTSEAPWAHWIYQPRHYLPLILSGMWTNHIPNTWITTQKIPIYWRLHKSQGDMRRACHVHMQMYACQRAQMHNERGGEWEKYWGMHVRVQSHTFMNNYPLVMSK